MYGTRVTSNSSYCIAEVVILGGSGHDKSGRSNGEGQKKRKRERERERERLCPKESF